MVEFEQVDREYNRLFSLSFMFRPWLKLTVIFSCIVLGIAVLWFAVKCVGSFAKATEKND